MARRSNAQNLVVYLNSKTVGRLLRAASGAITFRYDEAWLTWPGAMPVSISLPLSGETYRGAPVINVFENLLPDADQIRRYGAQRLGGYLESFIVRWDCSPGHVTGHVTTQV
jgi:serine/threonine-protein kinase HipA